MHDRAIGVCGLEEHGDKGIHRRFDAGADVEYIGSLLSTKRPLSLLS